MERAPPAPAMRVRVERAEGTRGPSLTPSKSLGLAISAAAGAARLLRALAYAHALAAHSTQPRPSAMAPKVAAVERRDPEPTEDSPSVQAGGGPG